MLTRLLFFLVMCTHQVCYSQRLVFEKFATNNGLPSTEVYNLFQDKQGYIWVFTEYGIVKYSGSKFKSVCKNIPSEERAVYAVCASPSGNMYFINSKWNVYRIHQDKAYRVKGIDKAVRKIKSAGLVIYDLYFDDQANLWLSSFYETVCIEAGKYSVKGFPKEKPVKSKYPTAYMAKVHIPSKDEYKFNTVYPFITGKLVYNTGAIDGSLVYGECPEINFRDRNIVRCYGDRMYLAGNQTIVLLKGKKRKRTQSMSSIIISIEVDSDGHVWVGTLQHGMFEFDSNLKELNHYFGTTTISDILIDSRNGIWVSTIGKGVYHCKNRNKKSYSNISGLDDDISMLKQVNGKLFVGTYQGLLFATEDSRQLWSIDFNVDHFIINDISYINNSYYTASYSGLSAIDGKLKKGRLLMNSFTANGLGRRNDNSIYLLSGRTVCYYFPSEGKLQTQWVLGRCRGLVERNKGEWFTSTTNGVARMVNDKVTFPGYLKPLKELSIAKMRGDGEGNIWFCCKGSGLYRLDRFDQLRHFPFIPSLVVKDVLLLKSGKIVVGTNKGAFVAPTSQMSEERAWRRVISEETTCLEEYRGKLYLGTKVGLFAFDTSAMIQKGTLQIHLQSVHFDNGREVPNGTLNFNHNQNDLYFNYDILDFQNKSRILEYKLVGPTQLNGRINGTEVHLQNMDPGNYELTVTLKAHYEQEQPPEKVIRFTIHPAFWQTGLFQILAGLLALGVILLVFWIFIKRKNKRQRSRYEIEKLLTEYRITALQAQVNPHFMSNSLVAIQHLILERETDKANLYIAKFSLLLRSLLDYSSKSSAALKDELNMIELYVELEQLRFSHQFTFDLELDPKLNVEEIHIPALITQPFVENAIWHGLLPLKGKRKPKLTLKVTQETDGITISIIDNGVGRSQKTKSGERESRGTKLIVQRIESLNQLYQISGGKIEFFDLVNKEGNPMGTRVVITLPNLMLRELAV